MANVNTQNSGLFSFLSPLLGSDADLSYDLVSMRLVEKEEAKHSAALAALEQVQAADAKLAKKPRKWRKKSAAKQAKKAAQREEAKMSAAVAARKQAEIEAEQAKKAVREEEAKEKKAAAAAAAAELKKKQIEDELREMELEAGMMKFNQHKVVPAPVGLVKIEVDEDESDTDSDISSVSKHVTEPKWNSGLVAFFSDLKNALCGSDADLFDSCAPFDCGPGIPSSGGSCHF